MSTANHPSLLMIVAHPDDEIFYAGTLAQLSRRGARVQLLSLTHGEAGKVRDPSHEVSDLATLRGEELRLSCERIGIEAPIILDFHDSGRGQSLRVDDPRALVNVDPHEVEAAVRRVIVEAKPQVIVTHDPHGGYDHPDHVVTYRAVTGAFYSSGVMGADAPERLFYTVIERETFRTLSEVSRGKGPGGGLDPDVFGTAQPMIAVSFDARAYMDVKLAAMAAHRSQFGLTLETVDNPPPFAAEMMAALRPVLQREAFTLGAARGPIARWPLSDFFDGLEVEGLSAEAEELAARS